jgi:thioredoxin 1
MLIHLEEQKFEDVVASKLCLVDFYATWCGPCRMLAQEFEEIVETTQDFDIVKVDIDEFPALAHQFAIEVVPTMIVFKDGQPVETITGYRTKEELISIMQKYK